MHSRMIARNSARSCSAWKVGLASALCSKATFTITHQTDGEAYCAKADTQVTQGKGRTEMQVDNQTKTAHFDTPYSDSINFSAKTEELRRNFGEEKHGRFSDGWKLEDRAKGLLAQRQFEAETIEGPSRVVSFQASTIVQHQPTGEEPLDANKIQEYSETLQDLRDQHRNVYNTSFDKPMFDKLPDFFTSLQQVPTGKVQQTDEPACAITQETTRASELVATQTPAETPAAEVDAIQQASDVKEEADSQQDDEWPSFRPFNWPRLSALEPPRMKSSLFDDAWHRNMMAPFENMRRDMDRMRERLFAFDPFRPFAESDKPADPTQTPAATQTTEESTN